MDSLYNFVRGPLLWIAFLIFAGGSIFKLSSMFTLISKKERFIYSYMSWKYSFRSIFNWLIPFRAMIWRKNPVLTMVTFSFHLCLVLAPLFLFAHVMLFSEAFGLKWWTFPDYLVDIMTIVVIAGLVFFLVRRIIRPEVRFVTSASDFVILIIVAAPFVTGFFAYHQYFNYQWMMILHVFSGAFLLVIIPFTRLSHMLFSPFTRAYIGSEFGGVRHAKDW